MYVHLHIYMRAHTYTYTHTATHIRIHMCVLSLVILMTKYILKIQCPWAVKCLYNKERWCLQILYFIQSNDKRICKQLLSSAVEATQRNLMSLEFKKATNEWLDYIVRKAVNELKNAPQLTVSFGHLCVHTAYCRFTGETHRGCCLSHISQLISCHPGVWPWASKLGTQYFLHQGKNYSELFFFPKRNELDKYELLQNPN